MAAVISKRSRVVMAGLLGGCGLAVVWVGLGVGPGVAPVRAAVGQEPVMQTPGQGPSGRQARNTHDSLGLGPVPDAVAAKLGEPLYKANCAACHGVAARGGVGPNLLRSVLVLHDEKGEEISAFLKVGRTASGMPAFPQFSEAESYQVAEFLHLQVELAANRGLYKQSDQMTTGDAAKGKAYFAAYCASCHTVTGAAGAGDLAGIGKKYAQPAAMLGRIAWPSKRGPREATVTLASGEKLTGTLVHYDDFETSLKVATGTGAGAVSSWPTGTVTVVAEDKLAGHRALLPKYSDEDLHNLMRYLLELK